MVVVKAARLLYYGLVEPTVKFPQRIVGWGWRTADVNN
jgi:hypothetical protein